METRELYSAIQPWSKKKTTPLACDPYRILWNAPPQPQRFIASYLPDFFIDRTSKQSVFETMGMLLGEKGCVRGASSFLAQLSSERCSTSTAVK